MKLFTIGFTKKNAPTFFGLLIENNIKVVIDVRLNNESQLAGFTKKQDLSYFLKQIGNIDYIHMPIVAPKEITLKRYRKKEIIWSDYEREYLETLNERQVINYFDETILNYSCLLCSEPTPNNCHRRLLAEYLKEQLKSIDVIHL